MDNFLGGIILGGVLTSWVWTVFLLKHFKAGEEVPGDGRGWK